jgi:muramoyltetrapeptide carboxypeptidase
MIIPPFLSPGDQVGISATAKKVDRNHLSEGLNALNSWGLKTITGDNVLKGDVFLAGNADERASDLQNFINNPEIRAIFCARGGYGTGSIIDKVDFSPLFESPKWIVGFSDITLLHLKLSQIGIASLHAPMPAIFHKTSAAAIEEIWKFLSGNGMNSLFAKYVEGNRPGRTQGEAIGGNLSMICHSLGTSLEIDTRDKILLLEEVDEPLYKIDRMMHQLEKAGKLEKLRALIAGYFTLPESELNSFDYSLNEIISYHVRSYNYPVATGFSFGHEPENYPIPLSIQINIDIAKEGSTLYL